jgi:hypothetical protein
MNASFRTAFWAMCLGFTVPMVLFVGVELTSGGKARQAVSASAGGREKSLRDKLDEDSGKNPRPRRPIARKKTPGDKSSAPPGDGSLPNGLNSTDNVHLDPVEVDPDFPIVTIDPRLESDPPDYVAHSPKDKGVPAEPTGREIPPKNDAAQSSAIGPISGIETRLIEIQHDLEKLGRTVDAQAHREPSKNPVELATQFLKQLHDFGLINPDRGSEESLASKKSGARDAKQEDDGDLPPLEIPTDHGKPQEELPASSPKPATHIYRPRYLSGSALHALVVPLLTPNLGRAGAADAANDDATASGVSSATASGDVLVVHDLPEVIKRIDSLFQKVDKPPEKVVIEAVVLSLQLNYDRPRGIDLLEFNGAHQPFTVTATEGGPFGGDGSYSRSTMMEENSLTLTRQYGLKRGILNGDPQAFITALQAAAPARRTDAWQVTVVSRQSANLMLCDPFGAEGSADQSVAGTILRIRPIIARNGIVHLDVRQDTGLDLLAAAGNRAGALTNQFALHSGQTAVIGGFLADQSVTQVYRRPGLGQLPLVGGLFCKQVEGIERAETIVLLTPHLAGFDAEPQIAPLARKAPRMAPAAKPEKPQTIVPVSGTAERNPPGKLRLKPRSQRP